MQTTGTKGVALLESNRSLEDSIQIDESVAKVNDKGTIRMLIANRGDLLVY